MKGNVSLIKSSISILPCTLDWAQTGKNTPRKSAAMEPASSVKMTSQFLNNTDSSAIQRREGGLLRKGMSCHYSKLVVNEFLLINGDEAIGQRDNAESR